MKYENVVFANFPELDEIDMGVMQQNLDSFFSKVSFLGEPNLHVSYKGYAKGGLRKQHEVHVKLKTSTDAIFASEIGWQLLEVMQNSLKKLEKEVHKKHSKK
jgi:hypothetical protein